MSEFRYALHHLVERIGYLTLQGSADNKNALRNAMEHAKALLARPEPDIEDEVNEGVWQLKLEGDRKNAAVFEAFGYFEPAAAEKAREQLSIALGMLADWCVAVDENGTGWDDWDEHYKDAMYRAGPLRELLDAEILEARKRRGSFVPSPPAATGEKCNHDLQLPGHTINVLGPLDAVCKVCKEEWHLPGDKP